VFVEPLVGNKINFRNFGDHYAVVVGNTSQPPLDDIRHAFLHFLLDPLPLRYRSIVDSKRALLEIAGRAPRLPVVYQQDFVAFFTECLIRAVELRLRRVASAQLEAALAEADSSGYVLERPLVQQLQIFEKAQPAMHYYFPDLVRGIDVAAEQKRLQGIQFAAADAPEEAEDPHTEQVAGLNRWLAQGDRQIAMQDAQGAAATFESILQKYPNLPRALYGLAVASVLQGNGERAKELFEKLVAAPPQTPAGQPAATTGDPGILAWSHVYLGRIHDLQGDRELAVNEYRAALAVQGAPEAARLAAQNGVAAAYKPAIKSSNAEPQNP
jgi:tetratricopeptide (TPR) repeat protein